MLRGRLGGHMTSPLGKLQPRVLLRYPGPWEALHKVVFGPSSPLKAKLIFGILHMFLRPIRGGHPHYFSLRFLNIIEIWPWRPF